MAAETNSRCARCGAEFRCGLEGGEETCWCMSLPTLDKADINAKGCYCEKCLSELAASATAA